MSLTNNNRADWEDVYVQSADLRQLSPWNILPNEVLFRLESPYLDEAGWCMFMGSSGEVFSLNIYLGDEGFSSWLGLQLSGRMGLPEYATYLEFFNQKMVQVEFVPAAELTKQDKALHKAFKISASGDFNAIKARYFSPGFGPITVPDALLPFLADCLEQTIILLEHIEENDLDPSIDLLINQQYIQFAEVLEAGVSSWSYKQLELPENTWRFELSTAGLQEMVHDKVGSLSRREQNIIYHCNYLPSKVKGKKGKDYFPLVFCFLEERTAFAYPPELLNRSKLSEQFVGRFCKQLTALGYLPASITGSSVFICVLLEPICLALDIELAIDDRSPEATEFSDAMFNTRF